MRRVIEVSRRDGLMALLDALGGRLRSAFLRRRHGYGAGFLVGYSSQWLGGARVRVGRNFRAGKRLRIELVETHIGHTYSPSLTIGDDVSVNDDVHIGCAHSVTIGHGVLMASKIYISDHNHGHYSGGVQDDPAIPPSERPLSLAPVVIGDRVWLGEMVSVLPGVTIGEGTIVGANSVVSRNLPPNCIAVGAPARVVKRFDAERGEWVRVGAPERALTAE